MELCRTIATWSKDTSTKCGCVIIGPDNEIRSTGYNGLPRCCEYKDERTEVRPEKYFWFEHAERNAIYNAARIGTPLLTCSAYITGPPCADCARAMVQAGIWTIYIPEHHNMITRLESGEWPDSLARGEEMLQEASVGYYMLAGV
jgi:dCMP deaminase